MRPGKAPILILIIAAVLAIVAGVGTGFFVMKRAQADTKEKGKKKHASEDAPAKPALIHSLGDLVVNLADTGSMRYAKLTVAIGFEEKLSEEQIKEIQPLLKDTVIGVTTKYRLADLHRKGGAEKLKKQLLHAIRERLDETEVVAVYLEAFAMQ